MIRKGHGRRAFCSDEAAPEGPLERSEKTLSA
jgi:hypothetical protein